MRQKIVSLIAMLLIFTVLGGCASEGLPPTESDIKEPSGQVQQQKGYEVDYLKMSPMLEENIETLFNDNEIVYTVEEVYLDDEKMYKITYEFTI